MKYIILSLLLFVSLVSSAVKAKPGVMFHKQSDGTEVSYYLRGDEYFSYRTTLDGFLLKENANGDMVYAKFSEGKMIATDMTAQNVSERSREVSTYLTTNKDKCSETVLMGDDVRQIARTRMALNAGDRPNYFPLSGSPKSLVILVNFSDKSFVVDNAQQAFTNLLNEKNYSGNGATGSAKDYFEASSNGQFSPNFVVVGPYDLPNRRSSYGGNNSAGYDISPREMVIDACMAANSDVDFTEYDTDGDGVVDNIFIYYAGHNEAEGATSSTIWPHRSVVGGGVSFDGVRIYDYACTSELRGRSGDNMCGIGTFTHEFGHVLGLPDMYATYGSSNHATLGQWDIMDAGSYNNNGRTPPSYSSYQRFSLGWLVPTIITQGQLLLEPLLTSNKAYLVASEVHNLDGEDPKPREFFMLENRQKIGWDELALPGEGMLIEHINFSRYSWENNTPNNNPDAMGVQIVRADGSSSNLAGDTYPGNKNKAQCKLYARSGEQVGEVINNIREVGLNISFLYGEAGPNDAYIGTDDSLRVFVAHKGDTSRVQTMRVVGRKLHSEINFSFPYSDGRFKMRKAGTDDEFVSTLSMMPSVGDSTLDVSLEILCSPAKMTYDKINATYLSADCEEYYFIYPLQWQAPRPILIVPPVATQATDVTPYTFTANWDEVEDASAYYLSVYSIEDEEGERLQDFTGFDKEEAIGWKSTCVKFSEMYFASSPLAMILDSEFDTIVTEEYFEPAKSVSFWYMSDNAKGILILEGYNGEKWEMLEDMEVGLATQNVDRTVEFKDGEEYRQFRFTFRRTSAAGSLIFDDFVYRSARKQEFILDNHMSVARSFSFNKLNPDKDYYYWVKATDEDFVNGLYKNITDFSNLIKVRTDYGFGTEDRRLTVKYDAAGGYVCYLDNYYYDDVMGEGDKLMIYNINGMKVAEVPVTSFIVKLPALLPNNIYIVKLLPSNRETDNYNNELKRDSKVIKFFYAE